MEESDDGGEEFHFGAKTVERVSNLGEDKEEKVAHRWMLGLVPKRGEEQAAHLEVFMSPGQTRP